jgi:hypothetical protein
MTEVPFVDRAAIERLFGVRARQANNLMRSFDGYKTGQSMLVNRVDLVERLDELAAPRGVASAETKRKVTVIAAIDALHRNNRPRRIAPSPPRPEPASLPSGVSITSPGEMAIVFSSPEELLSAIMAMAQSATKNFAGFETSLESPLSRSCVCTAGNDNPTPAPDPETAAAHPEEE